MTKWPWRRDAEPWEREFPAECSEDDVYHCFRLLLGRPPSAAEWPGHRARVGDQLQRVVADYLSSREFKNRALLAPADDEYVRLELPQFQLYVQAHDAAVGQPLRATQQYEPHVCTAIRSVLRPGMIFLDVGANIGFFTMFAASLVGSTGRVFAVEPFQSNLKLLYLNAQLNGFAHVTILPFAASDESCLLAFDNVASNGQVSPLRPDLAFLLDTTLVYGARLDDALREVASVDVIKIDVEGAEYRALRGARALLERSRPTIVSEFSPPALSAVSGVNGETYLQLLLLDEGYVLDVLAHDGPPIACGRDIGRVMRAFEQAGVDHIDIVARPA